ncbi:MAG: hypothetical protein IJM85_04600 [Clostridia bacterium]|nr:hypothetical protein [Clostridia bacterium]
MKRRLALLLALIAALTSILSFGCAAPKTVYRVVQTGSGVDSTSGGYVVIFYRDTDSVVTGINIEARFDRSTFVDEQIEVLKNMDYFNQAIPGFSDMDFAEEEQLDESDFFTMIARLRELDNEENMANLLDATFINAGSAADIRTVDGFLEAMSSKIRREVPQEEIQNLGLHIG